MVLGSVRRARGKASKTAAFLEISAVGCPASLGVPSQPGIYLISRGVLIRLDGVCNTQSSNGTATGASIRGLAGYFGPCEPLWCTA